MGNIVLGVVGAVAGGIIGGPAGASLGFTIGSTAGSIIFPPDAIKGPKQSLMDLRITGAEYGQPIAWVRGAVGIAGQMWWNSDRRATTTTTTTGGKGGTPEVETETITYDMDALYGVANNVIVGIARIWWNGKIVWSVDSGATAGTLAASADSDLWTRITVYTGAADQIPDPTYEAAVGTANAPAYRGRGSVFIEGLKLGSSGQVPNLVFEVVADGIADGPVPTLTAEDITSIPNYGDYDSLLYIPDAPQGGELWMLMNPSSSLFVAVSSQGVMHSVDGATWTPETNATANVWRGAMFGGDKDNGNVFAAVSSDGTGDRIQTSASGDGGFWTAGTSPADNEWSSVAHGDGTFVAVAVTGSNNRAMTSGDDSVYSAWVIRTTPADNEWRSVCHGDHMFVAVASSGNGNRVMTSPTGTTWTIRQTPANYDWQCVCYGSKLQQYVAVADSGAGQRVMTSDDDGVTWILRDTPADNSWRSVCYSKEWDIYIAVAVTGAGDRVMTSTDGVTWTLRASAADNQWTSVVCGNGVAVAVAITGTGDRVMTSSDQGVTWATQASANDYEWLSVCYGGGKIIRLSEDDGSVLGYIDAPTDGFGGFFSPLIYDYYSNLVWGNTTNKIYKLDPATSAYVSDFTVTGITNFRVSPYDGTMWGWVASAPQSLKQINTTTGAILQTYPVGANIYYGEFDANDNVWLTEGTTSKVLRSVAKAGGAVASYDLTGQTTYGLSFMAYDNDRDSLWIKTGGNSGEIIEFALDPLSPDYLTVAQTIALTSAGITGVYARLRYDTTHQILWFTNDQTDQVLGINTADSTFVYGGTTLSTSVTNPSGPTLGDGVLYTVRGAAAGPAIVVKIQVDASATITKIPPTVAVVTSNLCVRSGLTTSQIDVTGLSTITRKVQSLAVSQITSARSVIELLMAAYFYEAVVSDKIYFRVRGSASVASIPYLDLGATTGDDQPEPFALRQSNDLELPAQIALTYINIDDDYQTDTQYSDRLITAAAGTVSAVQMALGMDPEEAKSVADTMLFDQAGSAVSTKLDLLGDYCRLEPTDIVTVTDLDSSTYRLRLVKKDDAYPLLRFDAILDDATILTSPGVTSGGTSGSSTVVAPGVGTIIELMDIPILRDDDNDSGFYVAAKGDATPWSGGQIYSSLDGTTYSLEDTVYESAVIGNCSTTLGDWTGPRVFDDTNSVTVNVGAGTLESSTRTLVLDSLTVNAMLIGDELIQFVTATLVSTGIYTLTRLLRGGRGTEWAMTGHESNERCVLLRTAGLRRLTLASDSLRGRSRYFKGVTKGRAVSTATPETFTDYAVGLKPFSPFDLRVSNDGSDNLTFTWQRRSRLSVGVIGTPGINIPLGEQSEAYKLDVYSDDSYTLVLRTIDATTTTAAYSSAQQTADGLTPGNSHYVNVTQISAIVGRGYPMFSASYTESVAAPPSCGGGEVMGDGDLIWSSFNVNQLWPIPAVTGSGATGFAIQFVADNVAFPRGVKLLGIDESGSANKEYVVSECPHSFTPVDGQTTGQTVGSAYTAPLYLRFGLSAEITQEVYDCILVPGRTYYINVRDYGSPPGAISSQFKLYDRAATVVVSAGADPFPSWPEIISPNAEVVGGYGSGTFDVSNPQSYIFSAPANSIHAHLIAFATADFPGSTASITHNQYTFNANPRDVWISNTAGGAKVDRNAMQVGSSLGAVMQIAFDGSGTLLNGKINLSKDTNYYLNVKAHDVNTLIDYVLSAA